MFSAELQVLVGACRWYVGAIKLSAWQELVQKTRCDWSKVEKLADWHEVSPILYEALLQFSPENTPPDLLENLQQTCHHLAVGNLMRVRQAYELTTVLQAAYIPSVLNKGVHYATFYQSVGHRAFGDIDILVAEKEVVKAIELLFADGYALLQPYDSLKNITKTDYHVILTSTKQQSVVELHWKPTIKPWFWVEDIVQKRQYIHVLGTDLPVPTPLDTAALLTVHHGFKENWQKLKYLLDLCLLVKSAPEGIAAATFHAKLKPVFDQGILLMEQLLLDINKRPLVAAWVHIAETMPVTTSNEANLQKNKERILNKLWRGYHKFAALSWFTKKSLLAAAFWVMFMKIMVKVLPFRFLKILISKLTGYSKPRPIDDVQLSQLAWAVGVVSARWPCRVTCLPQALAYRYLTRQDPTLALKIGVNTQPTFQAHAWVEKNGKILIGETPETFVPLWTLK